MTSFPRGVTTPVPLGRRAALGLATALLPLRARAAVFPDRAVQIIVPYGPGGPNDIVARVAADGAGRQWGQPVVVENRPGGGGNVGVAAALQRPADGYTLLFSGPGIVVNRWLYSRPGFDFERDLVPVMKVALMPLVLLVNPSLPVRSVADLIALAKSRPGKLNVSSSGIGTVPHLTAEIFKAQAGIDIVHVPYRSDPQATTAVAQGEADLFFGIPASLPLARSGAVRAIAVTTTTRYAAEPDLPTIAESGLPGFGVEAWYGFFARSGTPAPVLQQIASDVAAGIRQGDLVGRLRQVGIEPDFEGPDRFAPFVREETVKWGEAVRASGAKAD